MEEFDVFTDEISYTKSMYTGVLNKLVNDIPSTPNVANYQCAKKLKADECLAENDDITCAFHLSEAVSASIRLMALYRDEQQKLCSDNGKNKVKSFIKPLRDLTAQLDNYSNKEKSLFSSLTDDIDDLTETLDKHSVCDDEPLHKKYLRFSHENNKDNFIKIINELPKEWTVVQLTAPFNPNENLKPVNETRTEIPSIYLTLYKNDYLSDNLGPINVVVPANVHKVGEKPIFTELYSLLEDNYKILENAQFLNNKRSTQNYWSRREDIDLRMKSVIMIMDREWMGGWNCLLTGKLQDSSLRDRIIKLVDDTISDWGFIRLTPKQKILLYNIIECSSNLSSTQLKTGLRRILTEHCNPDDVRAVMNVTDCQSCTVEFDLSNELCMKCLSQCFQAIHHFSLVDAVKGFCQAALQVREYDEWASLKKAPRHPVILIVDEVLDTFPWESLPILNSHPVSRIENIHMLYYLFKKYENQIVDGHLQADTKNGRFVINPEKNLERMEKRMTSFVEYWCPHWKGSVGEVPPLDTYLSYLKEADLFLYCGHGDGLQSVGRSSVESVFCSGPSFLCGCGSTRLSTQMHRGPPAAAHHHYRLADCPTIIGMLWEVTDLEVDKVTCSLMSLCVPSKAKTPWSQVNKEQWAKGILEFTTEQSKPVQCDRDLLSAICKARRSTNIVMIASSVVARGLPIRFVDTINT